MQKVALITGATGMDGSYLAELLLDKGYYVVGIKRRSATDNTSNLINCLSNPNFSLIEGDITDPHSMSGIIGHYHPDEIYNLAAQSHVGTSFEQPTYTFQVNTIGVLNILEAVRLTSKKSKVYQANTSEMMGSNYQTDENGEKYQDETTPLSANSPYAAAKLAAHQLIRVYREGYGIFACAGILFNHESPRRGENFVTRKITKYVAQLYTDRHRGVCIDEHYPKLHLGNIDSVRDFGYSPDYCEAMWKMLQQPDADDYMVATGESHSIKELLDVAFSYIDEHWEDHVMIDKAHFRPCEVPFLNGHITKAKDKLGWEPKIKFKELITLMLESDINNEKKKAGLS